MNLGLYLNISVCFICRFQGSGFKIWNNVETFLRKFPSLEMDNQKGKKEERCLENKQISVCSGL